jgi:hypothetical protein
MLPERLAGYLTFVAALAAQPPNRWEGFDLEAPDAPTTSLRDQIFFAGLAAAVLAQHPDALPEERERAQVAVAALVERLLQRRVWAAWASATERAGLLPDPVSAGGGAYAGRLAMLLGCAAVVGATQPYLVDPFVLRWSSVARFGTTHPALVEGLARQLTAHPDGAAATAGDTAQPHDMAHILWALRLHDCAFAGDYARANERWLNTLHTRLTLSGPRMPGRGALSSAYHLDRRRASLTSDPLVDAWALALTAPLAPDTITTAAERHWPAIRGLQARRQVLPLAFSYLLAVHLDRPELGDELLAWADAELAPCDDDHGRRYTGTPATAWVTALMAIGEAGGLGRLLAGEAGG